MEDRSQFKLISASLTVLVGVVIVLVFFFQPWIEVKLLVKTLTYSGIGLANQSSAILLVPLLALTTGLAILMFFFKKQSKYRVFALILSLLGVLFVILIFMQINSEISNWVAKLTRFKYRFGIMGVLCGFLIQLIGALLGNQKSSEAQESEIAMESAADEV